MKRFTADDQATYLNFLRNLLKDQSYVALAYMTGILPIKKYGEHSALNMFTEISMTNPRSVVMSMTGHDFDSYWTQTETYDALKVYIEMNFDGLRDKVTDMIAGEKIKVNPAKFQNDMTSFRSADDVLTLLIHLGYLTYDFETKTAWIPNSEVQQEFINSIEDGGWEEIMNAIRSSDDLMQATLDGDTETVVKLIARSH